MNNIEFFRREAAKKNIGLTELPTAGKSVTIAKGLEPIDFVGMIFKHPLGDAYPMVTSVRVNSDNGHVIIGSTTNFGFEYNPETGVISVISQS